MANAIKPSQYRPPWYLFNGHLQTIIPFWKDAEEENLYQSETLELKDGDFLELDWIKVNSERLMILSHGLEGNSRSHYVKRTAKYFSQKGWNVLAWNFRSCGRSLNRHPEFYHAGNTDDLNEIIVHCQSSYKLMVVCGFSIGGSMAINYCSRDVSGKIKGVVGFSVPIHFGETIDQLDRFRNRLYQRKFLKKLKEKAQRKKDLHPLELASIDLDVIGSLKEFTEKVTGLIHGYKNLEAFNKANDCLLSLERIRIPCLIVNAKNDPFLGPNSFPKNVTNPNVHLEYPQQGGHAGFYLKGEKITWMEYRIQAFLDDLEL